MVIQKRERICVNGVPIVVSLKEPAVVHRIIAQDFLQTSMYGNKVHEYLHVDDTIAWQYRWALVTVQHNSVDRNNL